MQARFGVFAGRARVPIRVAKGIQVKSKKLLVLIASIAAVVVVIVVLAAVFTVKTVEIVYHDFDGSLIAAPDEDAIAPDDVVAFAKGKSAIFLSKTKLMDQVNTSFTAWHAFAVVKNFPNIVEVHLVRSTAILKIDVNGKEVFVDCFGYVVSEPDGGRYIDATSAFKGTDVKNQQLGRPLEFNLEENNVRLRCILEAVMATWQCKVDIPNLPTILSDQNVFFFEDDGTMLIKPRAGGTIRVLTPAENLSNRLIKAYSVYYNEQADLQGDEWVITVRTDGTITTPNPDKK